MHFERQLLLMYEFNKAMFMKVNLYLLSSRNLFFDLKLSNC